MTKSVKEMKKGLRVHANIDGDCKDCPYAIKGSEECGSEDMIKDVLEYMSKLESTKIDSFNRGFNEAFDMVLDYLHNIKDKHIENPNSNPINHGTLTATIMQFHATQDVCNKIFKKIKGENA